MAATTRTSTRAGAGLADPLEGALLQDAEQLALEVEGDLADLVEEQRAAIGEFEPPDPFAQRPGEATPDMAEELALEQLAGDRRAVHPDHRAGCGGARLVDRPGDEFLAGADSPVISTVASFRPRGRLGAAWPRWRGSGR